MDGGSGDNTLDMLKKYVNEIDFWVSENDTGQRLFNEQQTIRISKGTDVYPNILAKTFDWARIDQQSFLYKNRVG